MSIPRFYNTLLYVKTVFDKLWNKFKLFFTKISSFFILFFVKLGLNKRVEAVLNWFSYIFSGIDLFFGKVVVFVKNKLGIKPQIFDQPIKAALHELKQELIFLDLFNVCLNTLIVFLVSLLICIIFNFGWEWSVLPSLAGFLLFGYNYLKNTRLINVEDKVPLLAERLRTVADNVDKNNEITNDLKQEVVKDMKKIESNLFIDLDNITVKLFSITIIAFITVIMSFLGLTFDYEFAPIVNNPVSFLKERMFSQDVGANDTIIFTQGNLTNAFGNKTQLIKLGDDKLELTVNPLQSELNFDDVKDADTKNFNPPVYPKEIYTSYDASYIEAVAKKNQAVVKSYFEQISR